MTLVKSLHNTVYSMIQWVYITKCDEFSAQSPNFWIAVLLVIRRKHEQNKRRHVNFLLFTQSAAPTEWQWPLSSAQPIIMVKLARPPGEGGGLHALPLSLYGIYRRVHRVAMATFTSFHYVYHHVQSCRVRSNLEGRYTPSISSIPLYVLCAIYHHKQSCGVRSSWEGRYTPLFLLYPYCKYSVLSVLRQNVASHNVYVTKRNCY